MPKRNTIGGKGYKKNKKPVIVETSSADIQIADKSQMYARVLRRIGGNHVEILCSDNIVRKGFIRGAIRRRVWMDPGDIILISIREFQTNHMNCDIIRKYSPCDIKYLEKIGELGENLIEVKK